jgi:hypothetical protein
MADTILGGAGVQCPDCGLVYQGRPGFCPQCGGTPRLGGGPELRSLRGLGNVLIVLLAVVVAAIALRLAAGGLGLGSAHWRRGFIDLRLDRAADITIFVLGILFVVWFRRARINAEQSTWRQRRARGWAFWGWIVPIVSLWFPFQIMGDIWRAGLPEAQRRRTAWLPALWWTTWLLGGLTTSTTVMSPHPYSYRFSQSWPHLTHGTWTFSLYCLAISALALIAIIRHVSAGPVGSPQPEVASVWPSSQPLSG